MGKRKWRIYLGAAALLVCSGVLSMVLGAVKLTVGDLWRAFLAGPGDTAGYIFWYVRLPRTAACMLAGAALAVSGAVIQAVLNNKLASPGIIGVNSGAGLGVTVCCALGCLSGWAVAGAAFGGGMLAVGLVVSIAHRIGASWSTVILSGVAVNAFLGALSQAVTTLIPEVGMLRGDFSVGGFSSVAHTRLAPARILIVLSLVMLMLLHNELDVLALGEETARGLGMSVKRMRSMFLLLAALLAGAAVSFAGLLGFVGLIVPHAARKLVGNESRFLLPLCALGGAGFVTACDLAARVVFAPYELPVGILMAVLGGPFFLVLLAKGKGGRHA